MICYKIIDLGRMPNDHGEPNHMVRIGFELPELTRKKDGQTFPKTVQRDYFANMGPKSGLRECVEGFMGKSMTDEQAQDFSLDRLLGKPGIGIIKLSKPNAEGKQYPQISATSKVMANTKVPVQWHPNILFNVREQDVAGYDLLEDWDKKQVDKSLDWEKSPNYTENDLFSQSSDQGDDLPF